MYNIYKDFKDVSYTKAKFLSDKSYAYDTVFFVSKFIVEFQESGIFNLKENTEAFNEYIIDIFNRNQGSTGTRNYYSEVLNLFEYAGIMEKIKHHIYKIKKMDTLLFINERMENAYIFNYWLTYNTFKNDGLLKVYRNICAAKDLSSKEKLIQKLNSMISSLNISVRTPGTVWEKLNTKYALTVLNFINRQNYVSRELKVQNKVADIESISVNVKGTKTNGNLPKKNEYLKNFDIAYVTDFLKNYLFIECENTGDSLSSDDVSEIIEMVDLKLDLLELQGKVNNNSKDFMGEQFVNNEVKARNPNAQRRFRSNLFKHTESVCAVCRLPLPEVLIASHIKPYTRCEKIYDAVNYENGLLLCPQHDALFESAKYMTIDSNDGTIKIRDKYLQFKEQLGLNHYSKIDSALLTSERKCYLKWHNNEFDKQDKN